MSRELKNHPSFFGEMSRVDAEMALNKQSSGSCYLTRCSPSSKHFRLSVRIDDDGNMRHFTIRDTGKGGNCQYEITGTENIFQDPSKMLAFYEEQPVNHEISSIGVRITGEVVKMQL